jgi:hypothetical protein
MNTEAVVNLLVALAIETLRTNAEASRIAGKAIAEQRPLTDDEKRQVRESRDTAINNAQADIDAA